jgi:mono/diheme cytochrome c family protein
MSHPSQVLLLAVSSLGLGAVACSSGSSEPATPPTLQIVTSSGAPLSAVAGDAVALKVVLVASDGTVGDLPTGTTVQWSVPYPVVTLPPDSIAASPLPPASIHPTGAWIENRYRTDDAASLANVLFALDPGVTQNGSLEVSAVVSGLTSVADGGGSVTANIAVQPTPAGDWTRGQTLYGPTGANCAQCHGATGHGSAPPSADGSYAIAGGTYDFPAPGINAEPGNCASDPAWDAALFAVASRADMDNGGVALRLPMPNWLTTPNPATGAPLATQDLADIFAFLKTQTN